MVRDDAWRVGVTQQGMSDFLLLIIEQRFHCSYSCYILNYGRLCLPLSLPYFLVYSNDLVLLSPFLCVGSERMLQARVRLLNRGGRINDG